MKSTDIRQGGELVMDTIEKEVKGIKSAHDSAEAACTSAIVLGAAMLVEIAAQLAEHNERENSKRGIYR